MVGMLIFWFFPVVMMLASFVLFWMWAGLFAGLSALWLRMWWRVWAWPFLPLIAVVGVLLLAGPLWHLLWTAMHSVFWLATWVIVPVSVGIWLAVRYPKRISPLEHR